MEGVEIVDRAEVRAVWERSDRVRRAEESTLGIFTAVDEAVEEWTKRCLVPAMLERLFLIGGDDEWARRSGGSCRVTACDGDAPLLRGGPIDLIAIEARNSERCVLLDGNHRAVALWQEWRRGGGRAPLPAAQIYVGRLGRRFALAAEALSTLWCPR